jgi:hypothetical protein
MWWIAEHVYAYRHVHRFAFLLCMLVLLSACSGKHVDISGPRHPSPSLRTRGAFGMRVIFPDWGCV